MPLCRSKFCKLGGDTQKEQNYKYAIKVAQRDQSANSNKINIGSEFKKRMKACIHMHVWFLPQDIPHSIINLTHWLHFCFFAFKILEWGLSNLVLCFHNFWVIPVGCFQNTLYRQLRTVHKRVYCLSFMQVFYANFYFFNWITIMIYENIYEKNSRMRAHIAVNSTRYKQLCN